jgi:tetratricopeptide (TPR) repeat protein
MFARRAIAVLDTRKPVMNSDETPELTTDAGELSALLDRGLAALDVGEFEDAIEMFERSAIEDSSNSRAWFYLGLCYLETRQAELAIEALNRAIRAAPRFADARYLLGTAMGSVGRIDQAAACYRQALEVDPGHQKAEEFLIRTEALLASRGHYRTAMRLIYEEPHEADWINLAVRELLHSCAIFDGSPARGEFDRLASRVRDSGGKRLIASPPDNDDPFWAGAVRRAEAAMARKAWPEAAAAYHEALDLSPDHAFIHHSLGLIYFALGDVDGGSRAWQQALDLDPEYDFSSICGIS